MECLQEECTKINKNGGVNPAVFIINTVLHGKVAISVIHGIF